MQSKHEHLGLPLGDFPWHALIIKNCRPYPTWVDTCIHTQLQNPCVLWRRDWDDCPPHSLPPNGFFEAIRCTAVQCIVFGPQPSLPTSKTLGNDRAPDGRSLSLSHSIQESCLFERNHFAGLLNEGEPKFHCVQSLKFGGWWQKLVLP